MLNSFEVLSMFIPKEIEVLLIKAASFHDCTHTCTVVSAIKSIYSADIECFNCSYVVSNLVKAYTCTQSQNVKRITVTSIRTITDMMVTVPMGKDMLPEIDNLLLLLLYLTTPVTITCTAER